MHSALARFAVLAMIAVLGSACSEPTPRNIIIVTIDTLRADHMSLYGYERETTPFLDALAAESVTFDRARAQAGCTFPSVNSLLTSRYASEFIQQEEGQLGIPDNIRSIAELVKLRGFETIAVSASPIVRNTPNKHNPNGGFGRGFDVFDESGIWREAAYVNHLTFKHLDSVDEPFLLYLHYMDPHDPYALPSSATGEFASAYDGHDFIARGDINPIADMLYGDGPEIEIAESDLNHLIDLYDDEIRYADLQIGKLVTHLREAGLLDRSLVVFLSDHGEEFLEHGHIGHCRGVWDTLTRTPLMMRIPGVEGGRRISAAVQNVDILPTVFDYLGLTFPSFDFEGSSLRPLIDGFQQKTTYAYSDQGKYRGADDGRWHMILDGVTKTASLYDLKNDPLEQSDRFRPDHPAAELLASELNRWLRDTGQWLRFDEALEASTAKEDELRALGYLQ